MNTDAPHAPTMARSATAKQGKGVFLRELGHRFSGTRLLFEGLTTHLAPGEVVGVVGPSGSGKSTLLCLLAGWVSPARGVVERVGVVNTGWVFQNPHGVARRTALDHVVLPLLGTNMTRPRAEVRALEILDLFSLSEVAGRQFRRLSGGEAQRLMLARAVATATDLLLIDEPTAQLDLGTAATVNAVITQLAHAGAVVVVATHDAQTKEACDRVIDLTDYQVGHEPLAVACARPTAVGRDR